MHTGRPEGSHADAVIIQHPAGDCCNCAIHEEHLFQERKHLHSTTINVNYGVETIEAGT
jgi:hypothetical protein